MTPRLVATDLDGTLVRSDGTVSTASQELLAALDRRGVPVVFVTARPLRWMDDLWPMVGRHGMAIVSNGAILYDVAAGRARDVTGIDAAAGAVLREVIAAAVPGAAFAIECVSGIRRDPTYVEPNDVSDDSPVGPLDELWDEPAVKLLVRHPGLGPDVLRDRVVAAVGDLAVATWSGPGLVEISAPGITKAARLVQVADELEVAAADVVAFGDMPNDLPMLEWAGTSYAMANADPAVLAAATRVAPANDDDGVAAVLGELFGISAR
jgi:hydroxymethylpyrimidine pyrophosphatase-like HAD family hydrolase